MASEAGEIAAVERRSGDNVRLVDWPGYDARERKKIR